MSQLLSIDPFIFNSTFLSGAWLIEPLLKGDHRGWFFRTYDVKAFSVAGLNTDWVQMNHSFTQKTGSIRGLHYQTPPYSEVKLVRCIAGSVYDVMVDLREQSPTFLQSFGTELSAFNKKALYIPVGFAHGFQTLTDNCELQYMHSAMYQPNAECGLHYLDPLLSIQWPLSPTIVSERDKNHLPLTVSFTGIKL